MVDTSGRIWLVDGGYDWYITGWYWYWCLNGEWCLAMPRVDEWNVNAGVNPQGGVKTQIYIYDHFHAFFYILVWYAKLLKVWHRWRINDHMWVNCTDVLWNLDIFIRGVFPPPRASGAARSIWAWPWRPRSCNGREDLLATIRRGGCWAGLFTTRVRTSCGR